MSFFQSIGGYQQYLQNALSSASNQQALEVQTEESESSMQNEDNIANQQLKSAGLSDLFLGSPVAIKAITEGRNIYKKAQTSYADIKKGYGIIKEKSQALKDMITTSPEKLAELRAASLGEDMTPEALVSKMTDLFGEKVANSPVGKIILDKVNQFKEAHASLKAAALEHLDAGNKLHQELTAKGENLGELLDKPAEALSRGQLDFANHIKNAIDYAQTSTKGLTEMGSDLAMKREALGNAMRLEGKKQSTIDRVKNYSEERLNTEFEKVKTMASKAQGAVSDTGETIMKQVASVPAAESRIAIPHTSSQEFTNPLFVNYEDLYRPPTRSERMATQASLEVKPTVPENAISFGSAFGGDVNYESLAKRGASMVPVLPTEAKSVLSTFDSFKSKAGEFYGKAKSALSEFAEGTAGKLLKGVGEVGLEAVGAIGGIGSAEQLAKGKVSAQNLLGAKQLEGAPELVSSVGTGIQKSVSSISQKAGDTLSEYAAKAKASVSDTMDLIKTNLTKAGMAGGEKIAGEEVAGKVGEGLVEKGLGELGLEAGLATIPIVGEVADAALGIGAVVSAVKDLFHKPAMAPIMPTVAQGLQVTRQAGVY
tara:strand:+ start:115 stop:1905 length:1791 start_codon:yes stop_codon:yes gene_type:complete